MRRNLLSLALAAGALAACAGSEPAAFRPTDRVVAEGRAGEPATAYDVRDPQSNEKLGEVNVWSDGAQKIDVQGQQRTAVYLGVRVKNLSQMPLAMDPRELRLEGIQAGSRALGDAALAGAAPQDLLVPPQSVRDFQLTFLLAPGVNPGDVGAFNLRWALDAQGRRILQFTPFRQQQARAYAYYGFAPSWGYWYDPYLYDPFGPRYYVGHRFPAQRVVIVPRHRWR
jgi:hypothetical protein